MPFFTRRGFLKFSSLGAVFVVMRGDVVFGATTPMQTLALLQNDLFPLITPLDIKSVAYLSAYVLKHPRISDETKEFIHNGTKWLNESSSEIYDKMYIHLSKSQRQKVLQSIAKEEWGKNFIYTILSFIMEATLSDPIYGASVKEQGWKWLEFSGGFPRPTKVYMG